MVIATASAEQQIPYPPDPPASFGVLGPEFALDVPKSEMENIGLQPAPVETSEQLNQTPAKFVPMRRAERKRKQPEPHMATERTGLLPAQSSISSVPESGASNLDANVYKSLVAETVSGSSYENATPLGGSVQDWWKRYVSARKDYRSILKTTHSEFERALHGSALCAGAGMNLFEWELNTGSGVIDTIGAYARMKRGPKDNPVVLEIVARTGAVTKLQFGEAKRAEVKAMAAAIRKQGKLATPGGRTSHVTKCRETLRAKLEQHHATYAAAANSYAAHAQLVGVASTLPRFADKEYESRTQLVRAALGPKLKGPGSDLKELLGDPRVLAGLIALVLVVLLVIGSLA